MKYLLPVKTVLYFNRNSPVPCCAFQGTDRIGTCRFSDATLKIIADDGSQLGRNIVSVEECQFFGSIRLSCSVGIIRSSYFQEGGAELNDVAEVARCNFRNLMTLRGTVDVFRECEFSNVQFDLAGKVLLENCIFNSRVALPSKTNQIESDKTGSQNPDWRFQGGEFKSGEYGLSDALITSARFGPGSQVDGNNFELRSCHFVGSTVVVRELGEATGSTFSEGCDLRLEGRVGISVARCSFSGSRLDARQAINFSIAECSFAGGSRIVVIEPSGVKECTFDQVEITIEEKGVLSNCKFVQSVTIRGAEVELSECEFRGVRYERILTSECAAWPRGLRLR